MIVPQIDRFSLEFERDNNFFFTLIGGNNCMIKDNNGNESIGVVKRQNNDIIVKNVLVDVISVERINNSKDTVETIVSVHYNFI